MGRMRVAPVQILTGADWRTGAEWKPAMALRQSVRPLGFPPLRGEPNWRTGAAGFRVWDWSKP